MKRFYRDSIGSEDDEEEICLEMFYVGNKKKQQNARKLVIMYTC